MESFVPTEYDNIAMDDEGFIYACTTNVKASTLRDGSAKPIRRLNLMGSDILIRNGNTRVIGDVQWESGAGYSDYSLITDVCPLDEGVYVALDKNRGHIFAYDNQGNMLYAFGGPGGNLDGHFEKPCSIDNMGHDLFVLDPTYNSITVFTPTEYGRLMFDAIRQYNQGDYITSGETWEKVLAMNGNCDLAYIGIGRSLLRQKKYKEAMEYFEKAMEYIVSIPDDPEYHTKMISLYENMINCKVLENDFTGIDAMLSEVEKEHLTDKKQKIQREYEEKRYENRKNSEEGNRTIANECFFTLNTMLYGIPEASTLRNKLGDIHNGSARSDWELFEQKWLSNSIEEIMRIYDESKKEYTNIE